MPIMIPIHVKGMLHMNISLLRGMWYALLSQEKERLMQLK